MRAPEVLQKCLASAFESMHALRRQSLLLSVAALIAGRHLVLIDLARHWPGARRVKASLKRLDRLLGNDRLHAERERFYAAAAQWLLRAPQPVIVVDWCRLKADGGWYLLRAAVPVGGRTLTVLEWVCPEAELTSPVVERRFLQALHRVVPAGVQPLIVTDAGFRAPWCRSVEALGWQWVTRLRHRSHVKPASAGDADWWPSKGLYELARRTPRDLGRFHIVRYAPLEARLVVYGKPPQGRHDLTCRGERARAKRSAVAAQREREPWLLACSPALMLSASQVVKVYAKRMQIESSFRDLKSHRFGQGFEDSLTRSAKRIEVLLLIHMLAVFAAWLTGLLVANTAIDTRLNPQRRPRRQYSQLRVGTEALARGWCTGPASHWLAGLQALPESVMQNLRAEG
jgi:hypothetical protein